MQKQSYRLLVIAIACLLLLLLVACAAGGTAEETEPAALPPTEEPAAEEPDVEEPDAEQPAVEEPAVEEPDEEMMLSGDSIRGGQLYDKWWSVTGAEAPTDDHPLWATQDTNERSGSDTWRCKECHGWDYLGAEGAYGSGSHFTGFVGVYGAAGSSQAEVLAWLDGAALPDHDFSAVMDEQALYDLTLFLTEELVDMNEFVNFEDKTALGDAVAGELLFTVTCSDCHSPAGNGFNFSTDADPEYLGGLASGNPWETLHKIRLGQPGVSDMPSGLDIWSETEMMDVLTYAQTLPNSAPISEGGRMYDNWWAALGLDEPTGDMPLWATQDTNERSGPDTWRCKECHGWDYLGAEGAYGSGSHLTGFTGVAGSPDMSADALLAWLNGTANADHDFSPFFEEAQMEVMVAFLMEGVDDVTPFINEDKTVNGDAEAGQATYNTYCARCHGEDGMEINFGDAAAPEGVGHIATDNPWEFFHKARFGQPAEHMPAMFQWNLTLQDIADLAAYVQTLLAD